MKNSEKPEKLQESNAKLEPTVDLFQVNNAAKHDPRYFAMLQAAVAIGGENTYEGGQAKTALDYYNYLRKLELPNCPFKFNLTEEQAKSLSENLDNYKELSEYLEKSFANGSIDISSLIKKIQEHSEKFGKCYLPSGFINRNKGGSHFAGLKIRQLEKGKVAVSAINQGAGIQYHPVVSQSKTKTKRSYQSDEYEIDLRSESGIECLQKITDLRFDTQQKKDTQNVLNPYSADDLYGLLHLYGKKLPTIEKLTEKAVTDQRSGNCTMINTHGIARDILIDNNADFKTRKRYYFTLKLYSLIDAFHAYREGNYPRNVLAWALNEFSTRLNKGYGDILNDEEMIYCAELQKKISTRLAEDNEKILGKKCENKAWPKTEEDAPKYTQHIFDPEKIKKTKNYQSTSQEKQEIKATPKIDIQANNIKDILNPKSSFEELYKLFNLLPHCTGQAQDTWWDKVPASDIATILSNLNDIARTLSSKPDDPPTMRARKLALSLMIYDIAAQLAPRYKNEFYGGFKLDNKYAFALDDIYSEHYFYSNPIDYYTVKRVVKNFEYRAQGKKRIFSNIVNYDENKYDSTVHYVIRELLNYEQRSAVEQSLLKKKNESSGHYTDKELFEHLMECTQYTPIQYETYREGKKIVLDPQIENFIRISATAHALGNYTKAYQKTEGKDVLFFSENRCIQEIQRERAFKKGAEITKHLVLPKLSQNRVNNQLQDSSENTIYHPQDDLKKEQEALIKKDYSGKITEYSPVIKLQPYQLYLSGSLQPSSTIWEPDKTQQRTYEELNEELRHIECSPHFQITRTLAWIANNLEKLNHKEVRTRINELLFQYGKLDHALSDQRNSTLHGINHALTVLYKHCHDKASHDTTLLLWSDKLAYDLRHYIEAAAKIYQFSLKDYYLPDFKTLLLERIKNTSDANIRSRLASKIICDFRNSSPLSLENSCLLLTCRIIANLGNEEAASNEAWEILNPELLTTLNKDKVAFMNKLNPMLAEYINLNSFVKWELKGSQLKAIDSEQMIELSSGALQTKGANIIKDLTEKAIADNKELFESLPLNTKDITLFDFNDNSRRLKSPDGKWEFSFGRGSMDEKIYISDTFQSMEIDGENLQLSLVNKRDIDGFFKPQKNPFESNKLCGQHYQYWRSEIFPELIFAKQKNRNNAYVFSKNNKAIHQLSINKMGEWQRQDKLLLNVQNPELPIEKQWQERLSPLFGTSNFKLLAAYNQDKSKCSVERIEHLTLGLSFIINEKQQIMSQEFSGYFLSEQQSLKAINGLPSLIILQNNAGDKKYLIPAFSLKSDEKNNALNYDDIIDYENLCNSSTPYFTYTLNAHQKLVGTSIEADLYLALIARSQGDFLQAMQCLERCKTHKNINYHIAEIAMQALKRPVKSPMGAAFDLKLTCYLLEHQQKWAKSKDNNFKPIRIPEEWDKLEKEQFQFYRQTFSSYKEGVSIIPSYLRLTKNEESVLENRNGSKISNDEKELNQRLTKISRLPSSVTWGNWSNTVRHLEVFMKENDKLQARKFTSLRFYIEGSKNPGLLYTLKNFNSLLDDAISKDQKRIDNLNKILFSLLQNDADAKSELYELIALLNFSSKHPEFFSDFKNPSDPLECIQKVGEVFSRNPDNIQYETVLLFKNDRKTEEPLTEKSKISDFTPEPVQFKIATIPDEQDYKHPLKNIGEKYFSKNEVPVAKSDFALQLSGLPNATLLEKRLFEHFQKGHEENQKKMKAVYTAKFTDISEFTISLKIQKEEDQKKLDKIKLIFENANLTPLNNKDASESEKAQAHNLLQARASGQKHTITFGDLVIAFLQKKPELLTERNPFLKQKDIESLFSALSEYTLLHSRVDQTNQILEDFIGDKTDLSKIEPYQLQSIARILDKPRAYDPKEYPEFLIYEYATRRILREDQVKALTNLMKLIESDSTSETEMRHALLQFAAGGGKTSVIITILMHRFARKGFLPVIFNTNELYQIGLEDIPKNLRACFQQNIEVIEYELEHHWTANELYRLLEDLQRWAQEGKGLLLKPITWHSINITKKLAELNKNTSLTDAAKRVLEFFKEKTVKLEDESHLISDPMQQSIKTYGKMQSIPLEQLDLLMRFYDHVMGHDEKSSKVAELAGITSNRKRAITEQELKELQQLLANIIAAGPEFKNIDAKNLMTYLTQESKERPDWLTKLYSSINKDKNTLESEQKLADLIVLSRAFIKTHLPYILSLQYLKDYGTSIHPGDLTVAPKHEGKDVTSHFGDHTLVAALTMQLYYQKGLDPAQVEQLLVSMLKKHEEERAWNHNHAIPTEAEEWLMYNIPEKYPFSSHHDLTEKLKQNLSHDPSFFKNPAVIKKYLNDFALPQIKVPGERQTSTAAEFQAGFKRSILLSATPGLPDTYPAYLKPENCFLEASFEAQVIDTLLQQKNSGLCTLKETQTPQQFFDQIPKDFLAEMTTLIDRGALLTDFDGQAIMEAYLGLDKNRIPTQTGASFSKDALHVKSKDSSVKEMDISGAGLLDALKKQGIKPETFLLFLFLSLSKTTGTDITRPHKDRAGLTLGKKQTVTEIIQASMRERQLLEDDAQTLFWIMFEELYHEIHKEKPDSFDPRNVFYWMIQNQGKETENKLINRAYQGIDQAINEIAWNSLPYKDALKQKQPLSPFLIYEIASTEEDTKRVLTEYKDKLIEKFYFEKWNVSIPKETLLRIDKIINETAALIEKLHNPPKTQLGMQVQQEMETNVQTTQKQEEEQRIKTQNDIKANFVFETEQYNLDEDNLKSIFEPDQKRYKTLQLPGCESLTQPPLILSPKHFSVMRKEADDSYSKIEQLKPIKMMLVKILPNKKMEYLACTAAGAEYYSFLLNNNLLTNQDPAYALITTEGDILHTSNNITLETCRERIASNDCKKILTYAHFLNGKISNPIIFSEIIKEKKWTKEDYEKLVNAITTVHVSHTPVSLLNNNTLEKLSGWSDEKATPMTTGHRRYKEQLQKNVAVDARQAVKPINELENHINTPSFDTIRPQHALAGYVLGEQPEPIHQNQDDIALVAAFENIKKIINKIHGSTIQSRDEAMMKLDDLAIRTLNSLQSSQAKITALQTLENDFKTFEDILSDLAAKLENYSVQDKNAMYFKGLIVNQISRAYSNFAEDTSIEDCKKTLKSHLQIIEKDMAPELALEQKTKPQKKVSIFEFSSLFQKSAEIPPAPMPLATIDTMIKKCMTALDEPTTSVKETVLEVTKDKLVLPSTKVSPRQ